MTSSSLWPPAAAAFPLASPTTASCPHLRPRRRFRWRHVFLAGGVAGVMFVIALGLSFRMGGEARVLRRAAFAAAPDQWERQFEFGIGRLPLFLARAGLAFAPLEPEARTALSALNHADVGIYHRRPGAPAIDSAAVFRSVQHAMETAGWEPLVLVREASDLVGVFIPKVSRSANRLDTCLLVLDGDDLVLVSARANLDPLVTLALDATGQWPRFARD